MNIKQRIAPAWKDAFYARFPNLFVDVLTGTESVSTLTDWGSSARPAGANSSRSSSSTWRP